MQEEIASHFHGFKAIELPNDVVRYDYPVLLRCLWDLFCYKGINSGEFVQLITLGEDRFI